MFAIHKRWQMPAARAWASAVGVLWRNGELWRALSASRLPLRAGSGLAAAAIAVTAVQHGVPAALHRDHSPAEAPESAVPAAAPAGPPGAADGSAGEGEGAALDVDFAALSRLYSAEDAPLVAAHLSQFPTVKAVERQMRRIHDEYGVPWWGTIVGVTLALRTALMPLNVSLLRNSLRMKLHMPEVQQLSAQILPKAAPEASRLAASRQLLALFAQQGFHPLKHFLAFPVLLPPTILSIFGAIHNLCVSAEGMDHQGTLWFPDLVAPDVTNLLPIASALTWLANVESGAGVHYAASPRLRSAVRVAVATCWPLAATLPNGVLVFWLTSNLFALARAFATRPDAVRRLLRIPLRSEIAALSHLPKHFY